MPEISIQAEDVGKCYTIVHRREGQRGLRHVLNDRLLAPFRLRARSGSPPKAGPGAVRDQPRDEPFWALQGVSFEIQKGEVVGIIGRNGAGKSTLLKILSRITAPTTGRIRIRGRVASLLEVGTGFHAELTGRENIYLNGAILGMSRIEVRSKFEEIVAFAEVERFLDTPVKRYSSGMYVRLAFAVAAHLEPETLIIDEVLAVGDVGFQRKCLGKMEDVSTRQGRTVLFVSHNMGVITRLCRRGILLEKGKIAANGPIDKVVNQYLTSEATHEGGKELKPPHGHKKLYFRRVTLLDDQNTPATELDVRVPFYLKLEYEVPEPLSRIELSVRILTADGRPVMTTLQSDLTPETVAKSKRGTYEAVIEFPGRFFMPGSYLINVAAHEPVGEIFDVQEHVLRFTINDTGTNFAPYQEYHLIGVVMKDLPWSERQISPTPG